MTKKQAKETILRIWSEDGKFPTLEKMGEEFGLNLFQVRQICKILETDGFLVKNGKGWDLGDQSIVAGDDQIVPAKTPIKEVKNDWVMNLIRYVMFFVGVCTVIMSISYTSIWNAKNMHVVFAVILSAIMILFSTASFELAIMFGTGRITKHWAKWFMCVSFIVLGLMVSVFTVATTIAGQFDKNLEKEAEYQENSEIAKNRIKLENIRKSIIRLEGIVARNQEKYDRSLTGNLTDKQKEKIENDLKYSENELKIKQNSEDYLLKDYPELANEKIERDFFTWLAGVFGVNKMIVQFWMNLLPALFIDLVAPISFGVALFLGKKS